MEAKEIREITDSQAVGTRLHDLLSPYGFECYSFKVGWYNEQVDKPFALPYSSDTLAFVIVSTPDVFENAFKPFICRQDCVGLRDPIDECMIHHFNLVKEMCPEQHIEIIHDFEMTFSRRPKVLMQTAGHIAGAAFYYQRSDVVKGTWPEDKKIFGVSVHPKYGGWFAFRGIVIFKNIECPNLEQTSPIDCVPTQELRKELLDRFNGNWQDWSFRDIVPSAKTYSEEQKNYFRLLPKDRKELVENMKKKENADRNR